MATVNPKDRYSAAELAKKYAPTSGYKTNANKSMSNSSFWLDDDFARGKEVMTKGEGKAADFVRLAAYQRAIGNFVRILTGRTDINVKYSSGNDSYTDSKNVIISARLDEKQFDSAVGLALHEASHVALTDFKALQKVFISHNGVGELVKWHRETFNKNVDAFKIVSEWQWLVNVIEDRRIDRFVYDKAPGYQGYYQALYDKYFNAKEIDQALQLGMKNDPTLYSDYNFHITNFANPNRNFKALPALKEIWNIIDIPKINRLSNTTEVIEVGKQVYKAIHTAIEKELAEREAERLRLEAEAEAKRKEEEEKRKLEEAIEKQKQFGEGNVDKDEEEEQTEEESEQAQAPSPKAKPSKKDKEEEVDNEDDDDNLDLPKETPQPQKEMTAATEEDEDAEQEEGEGTGGGGEETDEASEETEGKGKGKGNGSEDDQDGEYDYDDEEAMGDVPDDVDGDDNGKKKPSTEGMESDADSEPGTEGGSEGTGSGSNELGSNESDKDNEDLLTAEEEEARNKAIEKISKALEEAIEDQQKFLEGDMNKDKKKLSQDAANKVNAAANSDASYAAVGADMMDEDGNKIHIGNGVNCLVVRGLNESLIESRMIGSHCINPLSVKKSIERGYQKDFVVEGLTLGKLLGKRLQTRDEERSLKTTRLEKGRIDKRLIAELGFGNPRVFSQTNISTTTPGLIHISVDASGSMSGPKWNASMKTAIAIAQAASMVQSLDCVISVRGSVGDTPLMWVVYDSRKDSMATVREKFYAIQSTGSTPEGLCFEAIMSDLIKDSRNRDMYFINISDGAPMFSAHKKGFRFNYRGSTALQHTATQVNNMRKANIAVTSFFVSENGEDRYSAPAFKAMYGKDAQFIDVNNLNQLAKSINTMFERKQA